jgi:hypothetical protein
LKYRPPFLLQWSHHSVTPGHRGDWLKLISQLKKKKKNRYLASCSFRETVLLRSHHLVLWSLGTLTGQQRFYGPRLVTRKGRCYHPLSVLPEASCIADFV